MRRLLLYPKTPRLVVSSSSSSSSSLSYSNSAAKSASTTCTIQRSRRSRMLVERRRWITSSVSSIPKPFKNNDDDDDDDDESTPTSIPIMDESIRITPSETTTVTTTTTSTENNDSDPTASSESVRIDIDLPNPDWKIPGAETGGKKLAAIFTCKVCNTRSVKQFTEQAYRHGVVIVRCPKCQNQHLLADHLGYFDDRPIDLDRIAAENGESLTTITAAGDGSTTELDLAKLLGPEKWNELLLSGQTNNNNDR